MHEKCMKLENKCRRKGKRVLPALEEKNLAKELEENDKKLDWSLDRSKRERESVWKVSWTRETQVFLKNSLYDSRLIENASIDPVSIEHRSKQTKANQNF